MRITTERNIENISVAKGEWCTGFDDKTNIRGYWVVHLVECVPCIRLIHLCCMSSPLPPSVPLPPSLSPFLSPAFPFSLQQSLSNKSRNGRKKHFWKKQLNHRHYCIKCNFWICTMVSTTSVNYQKQWHMYHLKVLTFASILFMLKKQCWQGNAMTQFTVTSDA